ncbi:MAG: hypothetical protein HY011_04965 [Acidobacteria bacterium]|nr:hypothetical protein [Acidobacteriota bacterium]
MKIALLLSCVIATLLASQRVLAQSGPDFSGHWALDIEQSADLPQPLKSVLTLTMTVKQDDKQLRVENEITWGAAQQGLGLHSARGIYYPPRAPRRPPLMDERSLAAALFLPTVNFNLSEPEEQASSGADSSAPLKLSAQWLVIGENQVLQLNTAQSIVSQGHHLLVTNRERWTLAHDGKTLVVELYTTPPATGELAHLRFRRLPQVDEAGK